MEGISSGVEIITPMIAEMLLNHEHSRRSIGKGIVARYAKEMEGDRWEMNGEPIIIDKDGVLLDGHHRLTALVKVGLSLPFMVVRGVDSSVLHTLDGGSNRTFRNYLEFSGVKQATALSSITPTVWALEHANTTVVCRTKDLGFDKLVEFQSVIPSIYKYARLYKRCEHVHFVKACYAANRAYASFAWIEHKTGCDAEKFVEGVVFGCGPGSLRDPRMVLHQRLISLSLIFPGQVGSHQKDPRVYTSMVVNAWNAYADDRELQILKGVAAAHPFPKPRKLRHLRRRSGVAASC